MKLFILLILLVSCGSKEEPQTPTLPMMTADQYAALEIRKAELDNIYCNNYLPCLSPEDDGDSLLWEGILAFSGDRHTDPSDFQSPDGRLWRTPERALAQEDTHSKNSFSRDMLVGWLLLQTSLETPDIDSLLSFIFYLKNHNYLMCPENISGTCSLRPLQYRTAWVIIGELYLRAGLKEPNESLQARLGDETQLLAEATATFRGSDAHLISLMGLLYRHYFPQKEVSGIVSNKLFNLDPPNTFFRWLFEGNTQAVYQDIMTKCIPNESHKDYAWRRNSKEQAWNKDAGHGCTALINLILRNK